MRNRNLLWLLLVLVCCGLGLFLAGWYLQSQLVFGFDQARDAFEAYFIWHNHDLKILGPSTDIPGVFHGVLWYYYLAFVYFLGRGPQVAAAISMLFFFSSAPLVAIATQKLFGNLKVTALTVALYTLSPLFQVYTRWLSNPSLGLLVGPVLLMALWQYFYKPSWSTAFLSGFFFGMLIQTNFAHGVLLLVLPIYFWLFRPQFKLKEIFSFIVGLALTLASFGVAELKFGGQTLAGLATFLTRGGSNPTVSSAFFTLVDRFFEFLSITVLPWPKLLGLTLLLCLYAAVRKNKLGKDQRPVAFLAIWLFGFVILQLVSSGVSGSAHILVSFMFPAVALFSYFLLRGGLVWIVPLIFAAQIMTVINWGKTGYSPLSVQRGLFYPEEIKIIDYTYQQANGQPFIINSITNPLFVNTLWAYLYTFYGQTKYGYVPFWGGPDQAGYLGNLPQKPFGENLRYLIIEDPSGIPEFYLAKIIYEEDKVSDVIDEETFGRLKVQKRLFHQDKGPIPLPPDLVNVSPELLK